MYTVIAAHYENKERRLPVYFNCRRLLYRPPEEIHKHTQCSAQPKYLKTFFHLWCDLVERGLVLSPEVLKFHPEDSFWGNPKTKTLKFKIFLKPQQQVLVPGTATEVQTERSVNSLTGTVKNREKKVILLLC